MLSPAFLAARSKGETREGASDRPGLRSARLRSFWLFRFSRSACCPPTPPRLRPAARPCRAVMCPPGTAPSASRARSGSITRRRSRRSRSRTAAPSTSATRRTRAPRRTARHRGTGTERSRSPVGSPWTRAGPCFSSRSDVRLERMAGLTAFWSWLELWSSAAKMPGAGHSLRSHLGLRAWSRACCHIGSRRLARWPRITPPALGCGG